MDPMNKMEIITDLYRDFVLTGLLGTVILASWKLSGMHHVAISSIDKVRAAVAELKKQNHEDHEEIKAKIDDHGKQIGDHAERLARVEEQAKDC